MTPDDANDLQKDQFDRFEDAAAEREQGEQCDATVTELGHTVRCALIAGHGPVTPPGSGVPPCDHTAPLPGNGMPFWWSDRAVGATPARTGPVPGSKADKADDDRVRAMFDTREDFPRCDDRSATGGWATSDTRCRLESGHEGEHADGRLHWGPSSFTHAMPTLESVLHERLAARQPLLRLTQLPPIEHAVRVRFVDLPSRPANPELPDRHPMRGVYDAVMRPGGFALVVDRFRHVAHLEGERELWQGFGEKIGAVHVLLYPGTLDTDDLMGQ